MPSEVKAQTVQQARLCLLFRQASVASAVALTGAVVCAGIFWHATGEPYVWIWLGAVAIATGLRFRLFRRFFEMSDGKHPESYWLRRHAWTAGLIGISWGALPLVPIGEAAPHLQGIPILVPAFVLMAAITSYGVYYPQYLTLLGSMAVTTLAARWIAVGPRMLPEVVLFALFVPLLALTAKRYGNSLASSLADQYRTQRLVDELSHANAALEQQNKAMTRHQHIVDREQALARHVFARLTLGGAPPLPGIHTWNQSRGSLSGDLTQTARGPDGQSYAFIGDFTGHGLPAALGALPASSVFLAMAAKGLPVGTIVEELNAKLRHLLPVGYFCCAVVVELTADRGSVHVWNGGLPPLLIRRGRDRAHESVPSHSVPLGVVDSDAFDATARLIPMAAGDALYAYTDGLTEAENRDGEMWGTGSLERFLLRDGLASPRLPALIDAVLEHVDGAPASDDISVLEVEGTPSVDANADAA